MRLDAAITHEKVRLTHEKEKASVKALEDEQTIKNLESQLEDARRETKNANNNIKYLKERLEFYRKALQDSENLREMYKTRLGDHMSFVQAVSDVNSLRVPLLTLE